MVNRFAAVALIAITFIWVGLIIGISFVEAPLKFQAPGITLALGLGIGKLVFGALTKIEMFFSVIIVAILVMTGAKIRTWAFFGAPLVVVVIDNAWLMPILDIRIDMLVSGMTPPSSNAHCWYVALELIKVVWLFGVGIWCTNMIIADKKLDL